MPAHRRRRSPVALTAAVAAAVTVALIYLGFADGGTGPPPVAAPDAAPSSAAPASGGAGGGGQLSGFSLYTEPSGFAADQARVWAAQGRAAEAAAVRRIAEQPTAVWFADAAPGYAERAAKLAADARAAGTVPVLTAYYIPGRDCSGQSAGGAPDAAAYRQWVAGLAGALAGHRAVVVLEPDAVAQTLKGCLDGTAAAARYALLAEAVAAFRAAGEVYVYLDAGNPSWVRNPARMAAALRSAGVASAHGFALNVANFETTAANVAYGNRLSTLLGGAPFVIDTSRNGNGPAVIGADDGHWCNPPGRALGEPPTTRTGQPRVDAYLWIKRPGESDGACGGGAPPAGQWFPSYALDLAD
ncbi:glucanase [Spirilliplanes yamanashiensis]|uniref:Glucanase n=1 Tax=Spirilliplanes yamanashiensis TaxID=42233 RepID=A0A8J4DJX0_9ACTN|nr:glucanase [Spirilliplanes yamanashiensis]